MSSSAAAANGLPALPKPGDVVDQRFEIRALLGEGGMGFVYRALDRRSGGEVALKLLIPRYLGRPEREARLFREAELMQRVGRHPNLVEMLETGRLGPRGWPFLLMRIVDGESLATRLTFGGAMAPVTVVRVARQIAAAVQALHRAGVVHRDVTPMNVLTRSSQAVLIDLSHAGESGAPQLLAGPISRLTGPHDVPGTHHYMSREQACAEAASPSMDVYAFGVTLVHMLTGVMPSGFTREAFIAMQQQGMLEPPAIDVRVHPEVPIELVELARACTQEDGTKRPGIDEIVARLDGLLLMLGPAARRRKVYPVGGIGAAAVVASAADDAANVEPRVEERRKPPTPPASRLRLRIVAVGVALPLVAALWIWLQPEENVATSPEPRDRAAVDDDGLGESEGSQTSALPDGPGAAVEELGDAGATGEIEDRAVDREPSRPIGSPELAPPEIEKPQRRRPAPRPRPKVPSAEECTHMRERALAAQRSYDWKAVVDATASKACWPGVERKRLRVLALLELGRFTACANEGSGSADPQIVTLVEKCEEGTR